MTNYTSATSSNGYRIRLSVTTKSQSQANNSSVLNWSLAVMNPKNHHFNARTTGSVSIGGTTVWNAPSGAINSGGAGQTKTIASGTRTVNHAANGTASVSVSASLRTDNQSAGWRLPNRTVSGTYKPKNLAKKPGKPSAPSVSKNVSSRLITVTAAVPSSSSPITGHQIRRRNNGSGSYGGWTTTTANSSRKISFTPAFLDKNYQFQSRAQTAAGWGSWSGSTTYQNRDRSIWVRDGALGRGLSPTSRWVVCGKQH